jgi:crotonobetainyl-CoA:carnitine CoA-transferase CaiB-like acyl-CoA transferase
MVGAAGETIWARCATASGHPEWRGDPRFATNQARMQHHDALETVMNAVLKTKTTNDWFEVLKAAGVPCGPVYDYAQMFADPQVHHRGLVQYASDPELARCRTSAPRSGSARVCGCGMSRPSSENPQWRDLRPPRSGEGGDRAVQARGVLWGKLSAYVN